MADFRNSSVLNGSLVALALATASMGLSTQPAKADRFCFEIAGPVIDVPVCQDVPSAPQPPALPRPDPCFLAQNAMRPCAPNWRQAAKAAGVDPAIVGTWELPLIGGSWVLEVAGNGSYKFHSEARDGVASNSGTFSAGNGEWSLIAGDGYRDGGTYLMPSRNLWIATGLKSGTGMWHRRS